MDLSIYTYNNLLKILALDNCYYCGPRAQVEQLIQDRVSCHPYIKKYFCIGSLVEITANVTNTAGISTKGRRGAIKDIINGGMSNIRCSIDLPELKYGLYLDIENLILL